MNSETLKEELRARLDGEVRFDETSRLLYATDASLYQIIPIGVVFPRHARDVVETVRLAARHGVPVLPRGSGTSLGGQTVGAALVLDFTKYMHSILEVNPEECWVRVQPGVILDELNAELKPHGLMFAPDVATSNRASIGGMMGNNSCGARSILYGKTVDHVLEQHVVLSDGSTALFSEVTPEEWERRAWLPTLEGRIYQEVARLCAEYGDEVEARFPRIMRRVGGYNLDELVRRGRWNLAALTVGSEGTLAVVTEAKLRLVPVPKQTALLVSQFDALLPALEAVPRIVAHAPAAVELTDRILLDLSRSSRKLAKAPGFLEGEPEAILVTEFQGEAREALEERLAALKSDLEAAGAGYAHVPILDAARQKDVWNLRKAGLGLLMGMKGDARPAGFVEDTAVPVERLAEYISDFRSLLAEYGLEACYYAHASVGCLHVRPILNLKEPREQVRMREIAERVADLVLRYGGAMSAEHGDGLVRSEWQEKLFGPKLYQAFRELKAAFDPQGLLNPGKIVDAPRMNENLRCAPGYRTDPVLTHFDFSADGGFAGAVELCSGVGACRKKTDGTMCPSYRATLEEEHSTRGRANLLRHVLSGAAGAPELADPRLFQALDLCLECKACKSECPSSVDMAKLKYEFLSHYHAKHGTPLRARVFGHIARLSRVGSALAPFSNWLAARAWSRAALQRWLGIDARRKLPPFARETFTAWWERRAAPAGEASRGELLFLADTFTNYNHPAIGKAAVRVLEAFGYSVTVPKLRCCGRPLISKGLLAEAVENARYNVGILADAARRGVPVVGLEPSCVVTFKDEYRELGLGTSALEVAESFSLFEDFIARHAGETSVPFRELRRDVRVHGHCQQKAVLGGEGTLRALRMVPGLQVTEIPSGCCGMAGSFGYEREHYELSRQIGELSLFPHVRSAPEEVLIVAPGTSCRHQLADFTGRKALHPAELLALALAEEPV